MKKVLLGVVIGVLGATTWNHFHPAVATEEAPEETVSDTPEKDVAESLPRAPSFNCDGRIYCSQMTSCEEAKYFLQNCPGVKMDGEGDGVPCERQWCKKEG